MVGSADASWLCVNWGEVEIRMDLPLIFANTISLTLAMCVLVLKIRHG
jgi:uncharacterized protein with PQ loop repeat